MTEVLKRWKKRARNSLSSGALRTWLVTLLKNIVDKLFLCVLKRPWGILKDDKIFLKVLIVNHWGQERMSTRRKLYTGANIEILIWSCEILVYQANAISIYEEMDTTLKSSFICPDRFWVVYYFEHCKLRILPALRKGSTQNLDLDVHFAHANLAHQYLNVQLNLSYMCTKYMPCENICLVWEIFILRLIQSFSCHQMQQNDQNCNNFFFHY